VVAICGFSSHYFYFKKVNKQPEAKIKNFRDQSRTKKERARVQPKWF